MFRRRSDLPPEPSSDGPRDENLPVLSIPQAAALGVLAEQAFRARGIPATYDGAGALHSGPAQYGLHNLATAVAEQPWKKWPQIADRHVAVLVAAREADAAEGPVRPEQMLFKLHALSDLPREPDFDTSSGLPGIAALPAVDLPTYVKELMSAEHLEPLGTLEQFREIALENLRRLPAPTHTAVEADDARTDSTVHIFTTEDFFGASRVLVLDHLLSSSLKTERPEHGCLVAIPNRHMLAVHLVTGVGVVAAVNVLVRIAEGEQHAPGPISDGVFYLPKDGPAQRLNERTPEGIRINAEGPFAETLLKFEATGGS